MIHIEFDDADPEEILLGYLQGWVVRVNDETDILVTGTDTDGFGMRRLVGIRVDDESVPIEPDEQLEFPAEGLRVRVY